MLIIVTLAVIVPLWIWLMRWASRLDKAAKPPYSVLRRNSPYIILAFFVLLIGSMFVTSGISSAYTRSGLDAYQRGDYSTAETVLSRAEGLDGSNATAPYYMGLCLRHERQDESALHEFQEVCSRVKSRRNASLSDRQLEQEAQVQIQQLGNKP